MTWIRSALERFLAFLLYRVFAYRLTVIRNNLQAAFQYADQHELNADLSAYYRYLAKTIRQVLVPQTTRLMKERMRLDPFPMIEQWLGADKSVLIAMGHVGNWEWAGSAIGLYYPGQVCALYKKIKSGIADRFMKRMRSSHVQYLVEISQMGELLRLMKRKPVLVLMIADQNPGSDQGIIWLPFLGRETAFVNGPETLATRYKLPVVYLHVEPGDRWNYRMHFEPVYDGQEPVAPGEITQRFVNALERNIRAHHAEWLWSHRRWKRIKPSNG